MEPNDGGYGAYENLAGQDKALDDRFLSWAKTRRGELVAARMPYETEWVRSQNAYDLKSDGQFYNGRSQLRLPTIRNMTERLVQRVSSGIVGKERYFEVRPTRPKDMDRALVIEGLLREQMDKDGIRRQMPLLVRDAIIYGTAIRKVTWLKDERTAPSTQYMGDELAVGPDGPVLQPRVETVVRPKVFWDAPKSERVDIFNLYVNPQAQDFDDTDVVEVSYLTASEVIRMAEAGFFNAEVVKMALERGPGSRVNPLNPMQPVHDGDTKQTGHWEYYEFWGEFPLEAADSYTQNRAPTVQVRGCVLGGQYVVRLERNPYNCQKKPYFKGVLVEVPGEFYGKSLVKAALPLWIELNDARNQANDARTFAVNPVLLRGPGNADKATSYRVHPGAIITGQNLQFAAFPDVTGPAFRAEAVMTRDLEETFAAPGIFDAQSNAGSATEAAIEREEASSRLLGYIKSIEEVLLKPELAFRLELNRQFLSTEGAVRIKGHRGFDWRPFTRADIVSDYDFDLFGSTQLASKATLSAMFATTTDRMMGFEAMAPGMFDWLRWWETFFRDGLGIDHPSLFIKPLKFEGVPPTVQEVIVMLANGQRVEVDPRQDWLPYLSGLAGFVSQHGPQMSEPMLRLFMEHIREAVAVAKQVMVQQQMAMMDRQMALLGAMPPPGKEGGGGVGSKSVTGRGGANNARVGEEQRDGRGMSPARRAMAAMRPVGQSGE